MPKFKNADAEDKYRDKLRKKREVRILICADILFEVAPTEVSMTWRKLCQEMERYYRRNFDKIHKKYATLIPDTDMYLSVGWMYNNRRDINLQMAERYHYAMAQKRDELTGVTKGMYKTNDIEIIRATLERHRNTINGSSDSLNVQAEKINEVFKSDIPFVRISQKLPAQTNAN